MDELNQKFNPETCEELTRYTLGEIIAMYEDYDRMAMVAEAKRGKWKDKQQTVRVGDMIITGTYPTCNLCGQAEIGMVKQTNFCPNCGADMREINEKKEV